MPTTTVRVPDALRTRIARAAARAGTTPHSLMLEALEERVELEEARAALIDEAEMRDEAWEQTGRGYDWHELRAHLQARLAGGPTKGPRVKTWRK